jgi:DNA-binding response OmpR family regulator
VSGQLAPGEATIPTIVIADSEPGFLSLARNALEASGYRVVLTADRRTGLEKAKAEKPDLVIVGALEPRGEAFRLHKDLRGEPGTCSIPMLLVDVRTEEHSRKGLTKDEGMQMDAADYICRPVRPAELVAVVERILKRAECKQIDLNEVSDRLEDILQRVENIEELLNE